MRKAIVHTLLFILTVSVAFSPGTAWSGDSEDTDLLTPDALQVPIDVLPGRCPNVIWIRQHAPSAVPQSACLGPARPMVAVAILGTSYYSVKDVNPATVRLEGIAPSSFRLRDVARPPLTQEWPCECTRRTGDGFTDLVLQFDLGALAAALDPINNNDWRTLTLTGLMSDGTQIAGSDCANFGVLPPQEDGPQAAGAEPREFSLGANYPNPFNAGTVITYSVANDGPVSLAVYDVLGRRVATLADGFQTAGRHGVAWNGSDDGGQPVASGMYFYRLTAGASSQTRKMVLLK
jgi:hypothetical protein